MKRLLFNNGIFLDKDKIVNFYEALYLLEKQKVEVYDTAGNKLNIEFFLKEEKIRLYYKFYKIFKEKGYIVGTGLKFGGVFRIYENIEEHSKWIAIPISSNEKIDIYDFLSKNRVAHSTRKKILYCIEDNGKDIFLEVSWKKL
ncbi:MAG: tRNA-intron lyase [Nanopusillaceae archaeon]